MFNSTESEIYATCSLPTFINSNEKSSESTVTSPSAQPEVKQTSALPLISLRNTLTPKMEPLQPDCSEA